MIGTADKPDSIVVHLYPDVRGRKVEVREYRDSIRMANGRWTYEPQGFAAFIDSVEVPGRCRTEAGARSGVTGWIYHLSPSALHQRR